MATQTWTTDPRCSTGKPADGRNAKGQGMNWIRQEKRYAIYLRDGLACCYCGAGAEDDRLTLDHLVPHSHGGSNHAANLVTCCNRCNTSRGKRDAATFAGQVAGYRNHGMTAEGIIDHLEATRQRALDIAAAKAILARRNQEGSGQ